VALVGRLETKSGKAFVRLDNGLQRNDALKDVGALLDWIKKQPDLDADRVMVQGVSHGGFLALSVAASYSGRIRAALTRILFVLKTDIPWEYLPAEMGCGSKMTCWRRLHQVLLEEMAQADRIDWDRAGLDSAAVPAPGGQETGKNPTDRGKQGTKRHLGPTGGKLRYPAIRSPL
jgi:transposase